MPGLLPRAFYERPTEQVARDLLGKVIVRRTGQPAILRARIVEVEAYLGVADAASHARRGPTPRAAIMFGAAGHAYVYFVYGMHHCLNFVTEPEGVAGAVLIRAAEPVEPAEPVDDGFPPIALQGPGKLCRGLSITLADKGVDVCAPGVLHVIDDGTPRPRLASSARIGVDYSGPRWSRRRLRFFVPDSPAVSGSARFSRASASRCR
jgi:DNA-3-methyladenine glycosylase